MLYADLLMRSFMLTLLLSGVPLVACACTAGIVAVVQTATQIQEQTIQYAARFFTFVMLALLCGGWALELLSQLLIDAVTLAAALGRA
jgi:flagellar biosynthesis protein FliQ